MNAMAMDVRNTKTTKLRKDLVIDLFGGQEDLKKKILRRHWTQYYFSEDPLRMLRAARFAAQLGFTLDASAKKRLLIIASALKSFLLNAFKKKWVNC